MRPAGRIARWAALRTRPQVLLALADRQRGFASFERQKLPELFAACRNSIVMQRGFAASATGAIHGLLYIQDLYGSLENADCVQYILQKNHENKKDLFVIFAGAFELSPALEARLVAFQRRYEELSGALAAPLPTDEASITNPYFNLYNLHNTNAPTLNPRPFGTYGTNFSTSETPREYPPYENKHSIHTKLASCPAQTPAGDQAQ